MTRHQLSRAVWERPHRGVRSWGFADPLDPLRRARAAALVLPRGGALGGWAAAYLLGAGDLDGRVGTEGDPVLFCLPRRTRTTRAEVRVLRSELGADDIRVVDGVPVTSPVRTAFDLARTGPLESAVVALDALARAKVVRLDDVADYVERHRGWRGAARARRAVALADPRTRSCAETRLRLLWVLDAGLPAPLVNPSVQHIDGYLLGEVDLLDPEAGLVGEYDGAAHRVLAQHAADNNREEWLEDAGLIVFRATGVDLTSQRRRSIARLKAGHARGLRRDRGRDRWFCRVQCFER